MKKIFFAIIAAIMTAISANAQTFTAQSFTAEGVASLTDYQASVRAFESRQHGWQLSTGEYAGVKLDQHWLGATVGATYLDGGVRPIGGIAFG